MIIQYQKIFTILEQDHRPTMLELFSYYTPFQQLIATLLSSRTKDSTTIPLVQKMYEKYSTPQDFIDIDLEELEQLLFGIGFYKVKAQNIKKLSKILIEKYNSTVPDTFAELVSLPGVGRKTANCVLGYTFGQPAIAVDSHVHIIANRLGWTKTEKEEQTEEQLQKLIPKELWIKVNKLFVNHGQTICLPINPKCKECKIKDCCEFGKNNL